MRFTVIGPYEEDLRKLRREWNKWLRDNRSYMEQLRTRSRREFAPAREENSLAAFVSPAVRAAGAMADSNPWIQSALQDLALARRLGQREKVTTPNLASLMLHASEGDDSVLLTGDGHCDDVLDGLDQASLLRSDGTQHVGVLKVPHHGSEHNTHADFCKAITADKYVFCGNGAHENPDLDVVEAYIDSRIGAPGKLSMNPETGRSFRLIFNYHPDNELSAEHRRYMKKVLNMVKNRARGSSKLKFEFVRGSSKAFSVH
jgi:hypothetical protein